MEQTSSYQRKVLIATSLSYVVVILDTSIVNVALESISSAFNSDISGLQWVINSYTLTFASLLLTGGLLGDRFGAKKIYSLGLILFSVSSALCGLAGNIYELVAARTFQGIGAALLVPCSLMLINNAYPHSHQRAGAIGVWAGYGGVAMAAGPLVGGVLIELFGWRSIFLINVPIALVGVWLTSRIPFSAPLAPNRHMDFIGQISAVVALATSVAVLIEGGKLGWGSEWILAGTLLACASWCVFLVTESRHKEPMLPLYYFRNKVFSGATLISLISSLVFYGLFFLLSLYFQTNRGWSPLETGLAFLPLTVMVTLGSFTCGRLSRAYGVRAVLCVGFMLYALGFLGLFALASEAPYWRIALCYPAVGFGAGIITPAATSALMSVVEHSSAGVAAGTLNASRQSGSAFGVAIFGALLSAIQPLNEAIYIAISFAIGLSVFAVVLSTWVLRPLAVKVVES
ncbi:MULTISPECIES: MFS transporter [unclassified Pseudomonas]|uniref:MFS transporter n=1 Tax=unclassified Pseudomonas TaxID=196821 RepID=UPI0009F5280F|nr:MULTISPECIES: MFS transporter [unclassified Pseudomonas]QIH10762.1 MFS transporter [Pseudomonas sp. BIOMIG1BAC]